MHLPLQMIQPTWSGGKKKKNRAFQQELCHNFPCKTYSLTVLEPSLVMFEKQPHCKLSSHVVLWKVTLRLALQPISRRVDFFLLHFLLSCFLCFIFHSALQICWAAYNKVTRKLPLMNKVAFEHEKETWAVTESRRLQDGKINYWWIRWSKTHGLSISFLFSHKPLVLL